MRDIAKFLINQGQECVQSFLVPASPLDQQFRHRLRWKLDHAQGLNTDFNTDLNIKPSAPTFVSQDKPFSDGESM
jgi:hypothetical protein